MPLVCLLDSGTTDCIAVKTRVPHRVTDRDLTTEWTTKAGIFTTRGKGIVRFTLPEFSTKPVFEFKFHMDERPEEETSKYDLIIGTSFLNQFGFNLRFEDGVIEYDHATIPMRDKETLHENIPHLIASAQESSFETEATSQMVARMTRIVESKYEPADLNKVVDSCPNISSKEKQDLHSILSKFEPMFDGQLGAWNMEPISIKLREGVKPIHARPYTIPKIYELTIKNEIDQFVKRGILRRVNRSQWASPTFIVPKKLNVGETTPSARMVVDFRKLNERIVRCPYPVPKIQNLLITLEGFKFATSLDLVQGYYQMPLDDEARKLATIVLPWAKYEYTVLPMGISIAADCFQMRMNELLGHLPYVRCYIDDILIVTKGSLDEHLEAIQTVLETMKSAGLKVNAAKSFFCRKELDYLGYRISQEGIKPDTKKVEAISAIRAPTTRKQLRSFIGMVNFYRDMWKGRSHLLSPLTRLTSNKIKFKWTDCEQKAFEAVKQAISKQSLLTYPDFSKPFEVYTDASDKQLGAVILQDNKPIAHFSRTLNSAQRNYTVTDKETLSIVELLKEYRNILYGHTIRIYTDHKNITQPNISSQRIMRWRTIMEEFGVELIYVKGSTNVAADALSRLPRTAPDESNIMDCLESYAIHELSPDQFPLSFSLIAKEQQKCRPLKRALDNPPEGEDGTFVLRPFVGGGSTSQLICNSKDQIIIPPSLQGRIIDWYHARLLHPGQGRLLECIQQHFDWPKKGQLRKDVTAFVKTCDTCQRAKRGQKHYGHLPEKRVEARPWEVLHVDLYGPKTINRTDGSKVEFKVLTMIDPVTGWFEMASFDDKTPETITNLIEIHWLARYPRPAKIIADRGGEFTGQFFKDTLQNEYGIELRLITTANPQANAVVERIHQVIGNMIRTMGLEEMYLLPPPSDPFAGVIAAIGYAIRSTWHTTLRATPGQIMFGRDMVLNIRHIADWHAMSQRRQLVASNNNQRRLALPL